MQMLFPFRSVWPSLVFFFLPSCAVSLIHSQPQSNSYVSLMLFSTARGFAYLLFCHILEHHICARTKVNNRVQRAACVIML